jgi:hypothetical protein
VYLPNSVSKLKSNSRYRISFRQYVFKNWPCHGVRSKWEILDITQWKNCDFYKSPSIRKVKSRRIWHAVNNSKGETSNAYRIFVWKVLEKCTHRKQKEMERILLWCSGMMKREVVRMKCCWNWFSILSSGGLFVLQTINLRVLSPVGQFVYTKIMLGIFHCPKQTTFNTGDVTTVV